jgi:hypothetical protein
MKEISVDVVAIKKHIAQVERERDLARAQLQQLASALTRLLCVQGETVTGADLVRRVDKLVAAYAALLRENADAAPVVAAARRFVVAGRTSTSQDEIDDARLALYVAVPE